ncbi:Probable cytochrome P450 6a14 [Eumeta japonica]|uniref:unspecific monooxygenase n=1 Tax=Eumeta variegata TaxID=151549 RepID=A0A4C1ZV72_EUMVA|nr:Probable cytochrome P450 6a14 [Eumeta japonica]
MASLAPGGVLGELAAVVLFCLAVMYLWFRHRYSYWSSRGVEGPKPVFPFGNIRDVLTRKTQFFQPYTDNYFRYKHLPYVGMYTFNRPVLSINDLDVAKLVLIKDFEYFQAHGIFSGGTGDPLAGHLFNMHGKEWKDLRAKMSPTFTSGKLKTLYPLVNNIADDAVKYIDLLYSNGEPINFSELYAKYTMEIIGSVGFGIECNGFKNPNSEFYRRGHEYFEPKSMYWTFVRALAFIAPDFYKKLGIKRISNEILNFFFDLVRQTVDYRQNNDYKRNDFMQTLIELKNGQVVDEKGKVNYVHGFPFSMTDVTANAMLYMFAGYETSATTGNFAVYELALNPHIQQKARQEINRVLAKYNGEYTFEAQNEMEYINMILDETMRKYPPMRALFRRCTREYKVPNTDLTIEKGTMVFLPVQAYQMDPEIFPEPEKFDPERFSKENKAKLHPCQWMPFGEGPRMCLGLRQGYIQSKMALVKILPKYELRINEKSPVPMKIKASSYACAADGDVWINLKEIRHQAEAADFSCSKAIFVRVGPAVVEADLAQRTRRVPLRPNARAPPKRGHGPNV